ncbi:putative plasma membrane antiporter [Aspergillus undulatus]|uniref:putative plasma membrane antiporter n=1 Tax=Aspergillus undulatus TaxID=1810928 RepID=UPI003CCDAEE6
MPTLNVSELNVVISVLGAFIILFALASVNIKNKWYLGEALPAVLVGIILGPYAARFLEATEWGSAIAGQQDAITLGMCRIVIGVQLVIVGFQLPAKYQRHRCKEMFICLIPNMTLMWLATSGCVLLLVPRLNFLSALVIGSCVTSTDPILSQAIAKGPFADRYVARDLREIISSEAGINDGFGFPFLMLATYLIRYTQGDPDQNTGHAHRDLIARAGDVGHQHGGAGKAMEMWFAETICYYIVLGALYGVACGVISMYALRYSLRKKWVDTECYLLFPAALGLFILGICGCLGINDLLACFCAGSALNWDGGYLAETEARHDEVNSCIDVLLNFGGFMYIGAVIPWNDFHQPNTTGITWPRLFALGVMVLLFRRIPSTLLLYKCMPKVCKNWKEALFMGYFGPIGIGGVFYAEHASHLFPEVGDGSTIETNLMRALKPSTSLHLPVHRPSKPLTSSTKAIYFLVIFSITIHGLSIPILSIIYKLLNVEPEIDPLGPALVRPLSFNAHLPPNSTVDMKQRSILMFNRFSRTKFPANIGWHLPHFRSVHVDHHLNHDAGGHSGGSAEWGDQVRQNGQTHGHGRGWSRNQATRPRGQSLQLGSGGVGASGGVSIAPDGLECHEGVGGERFEMHPIRSIV